MTPTMDGAAREQLAHALIEHARRLRANGSGLHPANAALLAGLLAARHSGQRVPSLGGAPPPGQGPGVDAAITYETAAARLGVSVRTVKRRVAAGELEAVGNGSGRRVVAASLVAYVGGARRANA